MHNDAPNAYSATERGFKPKACHRCGAEYTPTSSGQKRCPPCAVEHRREEERTRWASDPEWRERRKTFPSNRPLGPISLPCANCGAVRNYDKRPGGSVHTCSAACLSAYRKAQTKARAYTRNCLNCGVEFTTNHRNRRHCSKACGNKNWATKNDRRRANPLRYGLPALQTRSPLRSDIFERDGWACWLCGGHIDKNLRWDKYHPDPAYKSIDHVIPLKHGGSHDPSNLRAAHLGCNRRRGADNRNQRGLIAA